ncbi:hypothetical protein HYFRA_00004524 [Hymenoscyphus fraxineus]|uniref:Uncharacterized protein n=1 Tax=Hymenoscyphus fraxineus TaxID=746836 RepID=A0A9N9PSX8_9HELO|nr:hypothetical protein HYFRA_00004524 [Hymenoscyphus fraxineus]
MSIRVEARTSHQPRKVKGALVGAGGSWWELVGATLKDITKSSYLPPWLLMALGGSGAFQGCGLPLSSLVRAKPNWALTGPDRGFPMPRQCQCQSAANALRSSTLSLAALISVDFHHSTPDSLLPTPLPLFTLFHPQPLRLHSRPPSPSASPHLLTNSSDSIVQFIRTTRIAHHGGEKSLEEAVGGDLYHGCQSMIENPFTTRTIPSPLPNHLPARRYFVTTLF